MARLLWTGIGAVGAAYALRRAQKVAHRFTPDGVAEQVEVTGRKARGALEEAVVVFRTSRAQREKDLVEALLVQPVGGDPRAVFRRGDKDNGPPTSTTAPPTTAPRSPRPVVAPAPRAGSTTTSRSTTSDDC